MIGWLQSHDCDQPITAHRKCSCRCKFTRVGWGPSRRKSRDWKFRHTGTGIGHQKWSSCMILTNWESIDSWCRASVTPNIASICCSSVAVALSVSVNFLSRDFRPGRKSRGNNWVCCILFPGGGGGGGVSLLGSDEAHPTRVGWGPSRTDPIRPE